MVHVNDRLSLKLIANGSFYFISITIFISASFIKLSRKGLMIISRVPTLYAVAHFLSSAITYPHLLDCRIQRLTTGCFCDMLFLWW